MIAADLTNGALKENRNSTLFGIVGFLLIPGVLFLAFVLGQAFLAEQGSLVVALPSLVFVLTYTALRIDAHTDWQPGEGFFAWIVRQLLPSLGVVLFVFVVSAVEVFVTLLTGGVSLIFSPLSAWLGWKCVRTPDTPGLSTPGFGPPTPPALPPEQTDP